MYRAYPAKFRGKWLGNNTLSVLKRVEPIHYGLNLVIDYVLKTTTFGKVLPNQIYKSLKLYQLGFFFSAKLIALMS